MFEMFKKNKNEVPQKEIDKREKIGSYKVVNVEFNDSYPKLAIINYYYFDLNGDCKQDMVFIDKKFFNLGEKELENKVRKEIENNILGKGDVVDKNKLKVIESISGSVIK